MYIKTVYYIYYKIIGGIVIVLDEIIKILYSSWAKWIEKNNEDFFKNDAWNKRMQDIRTLLKKPYMLSDLEDSILRASCAAELCGFKAGIKYGVMIAQLMQECCQKGESNNSKELNNICRREILKLIHQIDNAHALRCIYTAIHIYIQMENESKTTERNKY